LRDSFTCGISHRDSDGRAILDCLTEAVPPFDPAAATLEIVGTLKAYRIGRVIGDKYAAQWVVGEGRNGIGYEACRSRSRSIRLRDGSNGGQFIDAVLADRA
jgi:hypothetical protein